ncbi:arginase [Acidovorax sp. CCYZU-2555]|uniref:arginase n=1 Tax=Acidovorax sp. CCYZU-2555 TaxID=2835042 RepID=UPI001BCF0448|nr:arginase [Acidovorax sp. CCYZU-2555]MBS7780537.1 arginase [Acidovorax sp. CCYZU-2555]
MDHATTQGLHIISAEIGEGALDGGCKYGGRALLDAGLALVLADAGCELQSLTTVTSDPLHAHDRMDTVARFSRALADAAARRVRSGTQLLVLGGDHSCAIGTWSGVAQALSPQGRLGLIWVDAHLDAHTPESSESHAPHGMPLAALLGHGSAAFTDLFGWSGKIQARNLVIIGARSYESAERRLLEALGVQVIYMEEVVHRGFDACFAQAQATVSAGCAGWGLSFDLDGLDPADAPATGTPVRHGISLAQATAALHRCRDDARFVGLEIAEYNPLRDYGGKTASAVQALAVAGLGRDVQTLSIAPMVRTC